ncbi:CIC11C00000005437 [Sungouiella intermedia]|uniref:CIC11C00000005437 n=1 Tax=Sungouiella intermedia TaxID=45354 RepID=A0A1L0GKR5_9ASCO|nr:CIC11C00000005437 [[Candida] intermedia]
MANKPLVRTISAEEVRSHASPDDLWMVVYNKVYDVSKFATLHPGGVEVLVDCGGVDATEAFEDVGHSQDAFDMLLPYLVGELPSNERKKYAHLLETKTEKEKPKRKVIKKSPRQNDRFRRRMLVSALVTLAIFSLLVVVVLQKLQWLKLTTY